MKRILTAAALAAFFMTPVLAAEDTAAMVKELGLRESSMALRDMKGWSKPAVAVVLADTPERATWFQEAAKDIKVIPVRGPGEAKAHMKDADALVGMCDGALIDAAPKLKWVQTQQAGAEECLAHPRLGSGAVLLSNMQRVNGPNIAEHALALTLALTRQIGPYVANQQAAKWNTRTPARPMDLEGSTILIVGLGGIGTDIAKRADAFGMRVIATRNSSRERPGYVDYVGLADELPKLIGEADVVVMAAPLTKETTGLFDAAMFARMKPGAYFINIARGQSVVTADLVAALKTGKIAGAGLDVTDPEPLPDGHELWKLPNVVITPHVAGGSELKRERAWVIMRENLRRFAAGDKLYSLVDAKRGY